MEKNHFGEGTAERYDEDATALSTPEAVDAARFARMSLFGRWAGWEHEPFTDNSTKHVSVWQKD